MPIEELILRVIDPVDVVRANVRFQTVGAGGQFFAEEKLQVRVSGQNGVGGDLTASRLVAEAGIQIGLIRRSENSHVEAGTKKESKKSR